MRIEAQIICLPARLKGEILFSAGSVRRPSTPQARDWLDKQGGFDLHSLVPPLQRKLPAILSVGESDGTTCIGMDAHH